MLTHWRRTSWCGLPVINLVKCSKHEQFDFYSNIYPLKYNVEKKEKRKKKSSILQEKLALHTGISAFDVSILEQLLIATLSTRLSF